MTLDAGQGAEVRGEFDMDGHGRSLPLEISWIHTSLVPRTFCDLFFFA
jgi:hypothetical protein